VEKNPPMPLRDSAEAARAQARAAADGAGAVHPAWRHARPVVVDGAPGLVTGTRLVTVVSDETG
jgi:hypothetical protein